MALIRERLNRLIANQEWGLLFLDASLQHLASSASDHHPLMLHTTNNQKPASSFKFEEFWIHGPLSQNIIQEAWSKYFQGNPAYILCRKIQATKKALKLWKKNHFGRIQNNIQNLEVELLEVQSKPMGEFDQEREKHLQHCLHKQREYEESLWYQKSRIA